MSESLSAAAKGLSPLVRAIRGPVRTLRAERRAADGGSAEPADLMREPLLRTLRRLQGGQVDDAWWRRLLDKLGQEYVTPDFLMMPALQEWLRSEAVEEGVMAIAKACVMGTTADGDFDIRERLRARYAEVTGEAPHRAEDPIDVVVAVMTAGYIAAIPAEQQPLAGMIQQVEEGVKQANAKLGALGLPTRHDPFVQSAHLERAEAELSSILAQRMFDAEIATRRVLELHRLVEDGGALAGATEAVKNRVRYWAARLCAGNDDRVETAKAIRSSLSDSLIPESLVVVDALIAASACERDRAMQLVRDVDEPDARSVMFSLLARFDGEAAALEWCEEIDVVDQPQCFTHAGWRLWALYKVKAGHWEDAARVLLDVERQLGREPGISLVEGTVNAALLLPEERRGDVIRSLPLYPGVAPNADPRAERHRLRAEACFEYVAASLGKFTNANLETIVADWRRWLRLMNPAWQEARQAQEEIRNQMKNGATAVGLVPFTWAFQFNFEDKPLRRRLRQSRRLGGLNDSEVVAECLLNESTMGSREFAGYLQDHMERLDRAMPPVATTAMLFEALLKDGQVDRARELISVREAHLDAAMVRRMDAALDGHEGADRKRDLEELYRESGSLVDLHNLIVHLKEVDDRVALGERLREMFEIDQSVPNAYELVSFLSRRSTDHGAVIAFLDRYPALAQRDEQLLAAKAWALFHAGRLREAREINDGLLVDRRDVNALLLDVNLGVATGDWDRLPGIVEREWPDRQSLDAELLMLLGQIAGRSGRPPERALELAKLAASKAPEDPQILVSAYGLHFELGRDEEADPQWLAEAVEHSTDDGPIWRSDLKELVGQWLPAMRERKNRIEHMLFAGEVPICLATGVLNVPLSRLLLNRRQDGWDLRDGRHRRVIPTVSGIRPVVHMQDDWAVGLDVTSILVLGQIGLLETVIDALGHVKIAPDTIASLYVERSAVRFHQPTQVRQAQQLRRLIDQGRINVIQGALVANSSLVEEFGIERAALMDACRREGGIVVCVKPLYKAGSLMEQVADIAGFEGLIFSPADLCAVARRQGGLIDAEAHQRAMSFLASQDQIADSDLPDSIVDGPVYVDELALSYLQAAQILEALASCGVDFRVHESVRDEANALVDGGEAGEDLAEEVERIVASLRNAMERGAVSVLPRLVEARERGAEGISAVGSLEGLVLAARQCDALCVDDRYLNKLPACSNSEGAVVPVVCVFDVLRNLRSRNVLSDVDYWTAKHKLRQAGLVFVPLEADELCHWLEETHVRDQRINESSELRVIRQTVNSVDLIRVASEQELKARSDEMQLVNAQVIRALWAKQSIDADTVAALCTWLWRYLAVTTYLPGRSEVGGGSDGSRESIVRRISHLSLSQIVEPADRRAAYRAWVKGCVVDRMKPANPDLIEEALLTTYSVVAGLEEHRQLVGALLLDSLPNALRDELVRREPEFARDCGMESATVIGIGAAVRFRESELIGAARNVFEGGLRAQVTDLSGKVATVERAGSGETLCVAWNDEEHPMQRIEIPELTLVCRDRTARLTALARVMENLGPTARLPSGLRKKAASRTLLEAEMSAVFREVSRGVMALQSKLARKVAEGLSLSVDDIMPSSVEYWERFCGPPPDGLDAEAWLRDVLVPYRQELLKNDVARGLDICCLGALRDDLGPGAWVDGIGDEILWDALQAVDVRGNPIALLGALDVALYRGRDARFLGFAHDAIGVLLEDSGGFKEGYDVYRLFQIICDLGLNLLPTVEEAARSPGHWRRMCAWMQAGLVVRMFIDSDAELDLDALEQWRKENTTREGVLRGLLDIREEPFAPGGSMASRSLRYEVLRRLRTLKQRHEQEGRKVPRPEEIESAFERLGDPAWEAVCLVPGPAELHLRARARMPKHLAGVVAALWRDEDVARALNLVAKLSQCFEVEDEDLERTRVAVRDLAVTTDEIDFEEVLARLYPASIVAAAMGDERLADDVGALVGRLAKGASKVEDVEFMMYLLLQSAGAYGGVEAWLDWLEGRFVEVARGLPAVPVACLQHFVVQLEGLEVVMPMEYWFHLSAKRVAYAGLVTSA